MAVSILDLTQDTMVRIAAGIANIRAVVGGDSHTPTLGNHVGHKQWIDNLFSSNDADFDTAMDDVGMPNDDPGLIQRERVKFLVRLIETDLVEASYKAISDEVERLQHDLDDCQALTILYGQELDKHGIDRPTLPEEGGDATAHWY